ncbi:mitochondrial glycoprotein [Mycena floridula]|nr:mitochondrial glycoprotein [Mycena floridula]
MSAIRAFRQVSASSSSARLLSSRAVASVSRRQLAALPASRRAFSQTAVSLKEGIHDLALSQKLQEELTFETQDVDPKAIPDFLTEFKAQSKWTIQETPFTDEVTLFRAFGGEKLKLVFSTADLQNEEDMADEESEEGEEGSEEGGPSPGSFPIRVTLTMTKNASPAALIADMAVQEGSFIIENISFYNDKKTGTELSAEADYARRGQYLGPQFESLDVGLQEAFEHFLQERGVDESVALFIPEFAEYKEQQEYIRWLKGVKQFIDV